MYFLFHIPNPITWTTDQVANIINFFGAAGTVGALLYAFHLQRKNSKKINDLAEITGRLAEQNKLIAEQNEFERLSMKEEVRPDFVNDGASQNGSDGILTVRIKNKGHRATILYIEYKEDDVQFKKRLVPFKIKQDAFSIFEATSNGKKHIKDCNWGISIHYKDIYSNPDRCRYTQIRGQRGLIILALTLPLFCYSII